MPSASFFAASGVAPNVVFGILSLLYVLASLYVYISLIHHIGADLRGTGSNTSRAVDSFSFGEHRCISFAAIDSVQRAQYSREFPPYGFPRSFYCDFPPASWF